MRSSPAGLRTVVTSWLTPEPASNSASVKYFTEAEFDAGSGVNHEVTTVRSPAGEERTVDLWTGCYTPRELRLLARECGLRVDAVHGVDPGAYGAGPATVESSEFLLIASHAPSRREGARPGG